MSFSDQGYKGEYFRTNNIAISEVLSATNLKLETKTNNNTIDSFFTDISNNFYKQKTIDKHNILTVARFFYALIAIEKKNYDK